MPVRVCAWPSPLYHLRIVLLYTYWSFCLSTLPAIEHILIAYFGFSYVEIRLVCYHCPLLATAFVSLGAKCPWSSVYRRPMGTRECVKWFRTSFVIIGLFQNRRAWSCPLRASLQLLRPWVGYGLIYWRSLVVFQLRAEGCRFPECPILQVL